METALRGNDQTDWGFGPVLDTVLPCGGSGKMVSGGSWSFNNCFFFYTSTIQGENPEHIEFRHVDFWVHVHDLPPGFASESLACNGQPYGKSFKRLVVNLLKPHLVMSSYRSFVIFARPLAMASRIASSLLSFRSKKSGRIGRRKFGRKLNVKLSQTRCCGGGRW
ncbi:hypothetical protein J1N35_026458 [Gossypium stocksii]|uniref:DUF4283 domain-containing protein n=1 Tax=Gossypium stocksii TaxID=47602 RepID=A0A9D3ZX44_9ROSI|nr:hypothetical protein J1N35_026458 [Gossypium stocksii]